MTDIRSEPVRSEPVRSDPKSRIPGLRIPARLQLPDVPVPTGRMIELGNRGSTYITDTPGPTPDAPPIVLLHALATTGLLTWFPSIPALSQRYRVITMDQRWHGRGIRSADFTLRDCADDVAALLDALGIDQAVIAGYSMGSLVAQRVWRQHPHRVAGLILGASTDQFQVRPSERLFHQGTSRMVDVARRFAFTSRRPAPTQRSEEQIDDIHRWAIAEFRSTPSSALGLALADIGKHRTRPWIGTIDVPTAVIVPLRDKAIPPSRQIAMAHRIPGATLHQVDAGHSCVAMDADLFVPVMVQATNTVMARWRDNQAR